MKEENVIHKSGTIDELQKDIAECGFYPQSEHTSLELSMTLARTKIDNAMRQILAESELPLYLFDYLISSVQADIRKADNDLLRLYLLDTMKEEEK